MNNPLLRFDDLPHFDQVRPEHVAHALETLLADANTALDKVRAADFPARWDALSGVLDVATERLGRAWSTVSHLQAVADEPALRAAFNEALPKVTEFSTRLGADQRLYDQYKAVDPATLNPEQDQARLNALRNFVLGGAELAGAQRERFTAIQERLAELSQKFSENALDATDSFAYYAAESELQGVPDDVKQAARSLAQAEGREGFKLTLKIPCYLPLMQFAEKRELRQMLYRAYVTRASDQAPAEQQKFDNSPIIAEILALRQEEAALLGYRNYGELSLVPKMANSPQQVVSFLRNLAQRARPFAEQDLADMREFAAVHLGLAEPQVWDWPYIGEKLKEARYAFSEQEVKQYFPAPKVLAGLFTIVENLFEVTIHADKAPVWHDSVKFFRIERNGSLLGHFYLDPGARSGKRGGAWMDDARSRWVRPDSQQLQTPVAHLVCNFAEGVGGKPALLTHDDVTTLFHEFGHGLHHLLTQVDELDVSGISGVEWDAVELPSQLMENFCWEWSVLRNMTEHVDSGQALPRPLFDKMLAAKNFQSGLQTLRQIELALFDMLAHTTPNSHDDCLKVLAQVRAEVAVIQAPEWNRTPHTFSHLFAGGYAAGYYSYKWAEVLSADAYAAFEETIDSQGLPRVETGRRFRQCILEVGGSRAAMASFKAFRGREPELDALLRHQGMTSKQ